MVFVASFVPLVFCDLFILGLQFFFVSGAWPFHFVSNFIFLFLFHGFILVYFLFFPFMFLGY